MINTALIKEHAENVGKNKMSFQIAQHAALLGGKMLEK
jgi:hypothetical protein